MGLFWRIVYGLIIYFVILFVGSIWLGHKSYEFDLSKLESEVQVLLQKGPKSSRKVSMDHKETDRLQSTPNANTTTDENILQISAEGVRKQFVKNYEDRVLSEEAYPALPLSTGGICGAVHLLYGSLSEFLVVYHAPLRTSGNSGWHFMNLSITVLKGSAKVWNRKLGQVVMYQAGKNYRYANRVGERTFVELDEDTLLLIYGRGLVPMTMGYSICDSIFSYMDPISAVQIIVYYIRAFCDSLALKVYFSSLYSSAWNLASDGLCYVPLIWNDIRTYVVKLLNQ